MRPPHHKMENIIEVNNLTRFFKTRENRNFITGIFDPRYKVTKAVNDISFKVDEGESLAFLGPNGAGKTTTTKMLSGLIYPTSGEAKVLGYIPWNRKKDFLMQIGLVMGNKTSLAWDLAPKQSFEFIKAIYYIEEKKYKERLDMLSELLDVKKLLNTQLRYLSLGERMKMELIGAILHNPKVLFLDEPTIGLDIISKKNVRLFLRNIQKDSNITLILTSHDMDDVEKVCDRVLVINKGMKVYDGQLTDLVSEYNKEKFIKVYFENIPADFNDYPYAKIEKIDGDTVTFQVEKEKVPQLISELVSKNTVLDIDIVSVPLEEIIEDIFKKSSNISTLA
jgi:ABC-2 type transport system ATP-binding protein